MSDVDSKSITSSYQQGITAGVLSYLCWGFFPIYWKLLKSVTAFEILAHRIVWSCLFYFLLLVFIFKIQPRKLFQQSLRSWIQSLAAALLLAVNWGLYIYAVNEGHILEGSLAYFINPLLNVLVGVVFFKENFPKPLKIAVFFAGLGVLWKVVSNVVFPWISLVLAITFCFYGVVKKSLKVEPSLSSVMEGMTLLIPAVIAMFYYRGNPSIQFGAKEWALLIFSGVVTGVPLFLFSFAAQKIPYSMMGVLQFIAPSLQFLVGYWMFSEPVDNANWMAFFLIWIGAGFYLYDRFRMTRRSLLLQQK